MGVVLALIFRGRWLAFSGVAVAILAVLQPWDTLRGLLVWVALALLIAQIAATLMARRPPGPAARRLPPPRGESPS